MTTQQPGTLTSLHRTPVQVKLNKMSKWVAQYTWAAVNTPGRTAKKSICVENTAQHVMFHLYTNNSGTHCAVDCISP